jgi:hypothetical protein
MVLGGIASQSGRAPEYSQKNARKKTLAKKRSQKNAYGSDISYATALPWH